ncbi:nascent polypeptide-associated complex subunit alpha, muscle-specific form-like [Cyprinus carpio]|uniref:Nascent polypeptide-associated complex subunit alpha, muscle-specific form-like n=1 Tax=Cyprinus carpio TaxID=7962 RepID=A0A9Q9ZSW9_CYPCA|nr:nascent polypeptide-associated complex subunit alpha, muscle-specific form-like [Cyprinus carpio]
MSAMHYSPIDEHDELITALLAGRWWAIMELDDLLRSSSKKECGDLTSGQWREIVEAPQGAPVTPQYQQGELVPARSPEKDQEEVPVPGLFPEAALVATVGQQEVPVPILSLEEVLVADGSPQGAPMPSRKQLKGKLKIPQNMRLSVRDAILTPLPLRPPKGPPPKPAKYPNGAPVPASSPGEAPVPTRSPEEAPVPASAQVEAPVPKEPPVASSPQEEESVSTSSLVADGSPQGAPLPARNRFRGKMKVSENMRLFLKKDVILTPLPLRPPKGPGLPSRPAKTPKGAAVPASSTGEVPVLSLSPKKGPVHTSSQTKALMPASSQEEAPVSTATAEEVLVPARSPEKAAVPASSQEGAPVTTASLNDAHMPAMSLKRSPRLSVSLQGATKSILKRLCPWSTGDLENADVVQPPPHKICVRKDTHQHILKRPCPWSSERSDSEDVIQLLLPKKQRVGKEPKDAIKRTREQHLVYMHK